MTKGKEIMENEAKETTKEELPPAFNPRPFTLPNDEKMRAYLEGTESQKYSGQLVVMELLLAKPSMKTASQGPEGTLGSMTRQAAQSDFSARVADFSLLTPEEQEVVLTRRTADLLGYVSVVAKSRRLAEVTITPRFPV